MMFQAHVLFFSVKDKNYLNVAFFTLIFISVSKNDETLAQM